MGKKKKKNTNNSNVEIATKIENTSNLEIHKEFNNKKETKKKKNILVHGFLFIVLFTSLAYFVVNLFFNTSDNNVIYTLINSLLLMLFTILFVSVSITTDRKSKGTIFISSLCLFCFFIFGIGTNCGYINFGSYNKVINFSGKSLTEVVKWSEKNNIELIQEYEYSDMIKEYSIISQDVKAGTKVDDIKNLTVAVSEGPNPSKEVIVPNMVSWDDERVLTFIKDNYLSNVIVEFVSSEKAVNTVIEQSKSGNLKRDEELKLTFSYGEELDFEEVKLIDFTNMSKFEVEFYMKKNQLRYEFDNDFSNKIKRGYALKQSIKAGDVVKINDEVVKVTISKGPKIKVPDLINMSMSDITDWVIKNKLKLEFTDKYDDSVKDNDVISASHKKGDVVEQGTIIKIVISKGSLKMPKFNSFNEFRDWADKYEIKYEEKHEFSDEVAAGEVIEYSYKAGDIIKNDDVIVVTISDGEKLEVPNLKNMTKSEITSKLKSLGLNYNFVYKYSNNVAEGKAISQSISAGSEVSKGTTITVTLSKGKNTEPEYKKESSSSSNKPSSNNNSSSNANTPTTPTCDTSVKTTVYIYDELFSSDPSVTCNNIKRAYSKVKFNCTYKSGTGLANGLLVNSSSIDAHSFDHCNTVTLVISSG